MSFLQQSIAAVQSYIDQYNLVRGGSGSGSGSQPSQGGSSQSRVNANNTRSVQNSIVGGLSLRKLYQSDQKQSNSPTPYNTDPDDPGISPINTQPPDQGVRLQATADPSNRIPVVYGEAFTGGKLIDVEMSSDNKTMYYVIVFSEKTGTKIDGTQSVITFEDVYINNMRCVFQSDGVTVDYTQDRNELPDESLRGLVRVHCYSGNSSSPVAVSGFATPSQSASSVMPSWTASDSMSDLIFAVVTVDYAPGKSSDKLPNITAHLKNTLTEPGDCLYDYMTNTRYGAGIPESEILVS